MSSPLFNYRCHIWLVGIYLTGIGASIQIAQCEILLAQYFKAKLPAITHLSHAVSALGFILAPVVLGRHLLVNTETQVLLWYQAIILQVCGISLPQCYYITLKKKMVCRDWY